MARCDRCLRKVGGPDAAKYPIGIVAAKGADALLVLTEWDEFRTVDLNELKKIMKGDYIFDGRNIYEPEEAIAAGFHYVGIGRRIMKKSDDRKSGIKVKINNPKSKKSLILIKKD